MKKISFRCSGCGIALTSPAGNKRRQARCPLCGEKQSIPNQSGVTTENDTSGLTEAVEVEDGTLFRVRPEHVWVIVGIGGGSVVALAVMLFLSVLLSRSSEVVPPTPQLEVRVVTAKKAPVNPPPSTTQETVPAKPPHPALPAIAPNVKAMDSVAVLYTNAGQGSGFVVKDKSLIATNAHVIDGAKSIKAVFNDGTEIPVDGVFATSVGHDLAVLHLASRAKAPPLPLEADPVDPASDVWTLGAPQGLKFTMTKGIVSGYLRWRDIPEDIRPDDPREMDSLWVQTDAAISGGNSGGPLVTASGKVLGINTLASTSPIIQNVNFAIHSKHLESLLATLPQKPRPLTVLSGGNRQSSLQSKPPVGLSEQAKLDIAAWDRTAETLGDGLFELIVAIVPLHQAAKDTRLAKTQIQRLLGVIARESLAAAERLGRISKKSINPNLAAYIESQQDSLLQIHSTSRALAKLPDLEQPFNTLEEEAAVEAVFKAPFEILATEAKAVRERLEWLHGQSVGGELGLSERALGRVAEFVVKLARNDRSARGENVETTVENVLPFELPQLDPFSIAWDSYHRARRQGGDGRAVLQTIVTFAPGSPAAERAQKLLDELAD